MQLIISRKGVMLKVADDCLLVQAGEDKQRFSAHTLSAIVLAPGIALSSDVLLWAIGHQIDLLLHDGLGRPQGRIWSHLYGSISTIRKNQVLFGQSQAATGWIIDILCEKIENCAALLYAFMADQPEQEAGIEKSVYRLNHFKQKIDALRQRSIKEAAPTLRGIEGSASRVYFSMLSQLLPEDYRFSGRIFHPARDRFNCLLNYAYGMLYGIIEGGLLHKGLDPYLGIFHADEYKRPVMVYDIIEKYRIWADYVVTDLCQQQILHEQHFDFSDHNSCTLSLESRRWLAQQMHDYLDERLLYKGSLISRRQQVNAFCQTLANRLKAGNF